MEIEISFKTHIYISLNHHRITQSRHSSLHNPKYKYIYRERVASSSETWTCRREEEQGKLMQWTWTLEKWGKSWDPGGEWDQGGKQQKETKGGKKTMRTKRGPWTRRQATETPQEGERTKRFEIELNPVIQKELRNKTEVWWKHEGTSSEEELRHAGGREKKSGILI